MVGKSVQTEPNFPKSKQNSTIVLDGTILTQNSNSANCSSYLFNGPLRFKGDKNANNFSLSNINHFVSDNISKPNHENQDLNIL